MTAPIPLVATFSIAALATKVLLLFYRSTRRSLRNGWFLGFFLAIMGINICEVGCIVHGQPDKTAVLILQWYHLSCLLMGATLAGLVLSVLGRLSTATRFAVFALFATGAVAVASPGTAIADARSIGYAITRVPGPFYWTFQVTFLTLLFTSLALLAVGIIKGGTVVQRLRCKALLLAAAPIIIVGTSVVILMQFGVRVNAVALGSISIICFLIAFIITDSEVVLVNGEPRQDRLCRLLAKWPVTAESRLTALVRKAVAEPEDDEFHSSVGSFERALVVHTLKLCDGNKSQAAKLLGISRTTLRRKMGEQPD